MGLIDIIREHIEVPVPVIKATMMGPRAVGKTSIMASIFSDSRDNIAGTGIQFRPTKDSIQDLSSKRILLQKIITDKEEFQDTPDTGAVAASASETTFYFEMGLTGNGASLNVEIKDFPGEYLTNEIYKDKVEGYLSESQIVMVAIDTPYMMENGGIYNEGKNKVKIVTDFIVNHPQELKNKMIMFVPLKSELYFHDKTIKQVAEKVREVYSEIIEFCKKTNIACVTTPIQTLGGVEFDKFIDHKIFDGSVNKLSSYRFYGTPPKYQPMFCVQPVYYLMTYLCDYYRWLQYQPQNLWERLKGSVFSMLKKDTEFYFKVEKLARNIVTDPEMGYDIIYNNTIVNIK